MARLSDLYNAIGNYLYTHEDKEITSVETWCGSAPIKYTLHLHDIHEGSIGTNPYTGEDYINVPR
jgi:hypothetical protein